jgi:hypothetical protein
MEKTYKIPEGSEESVDNMVSVAVERFLAQQLKETPVQEKPEYKDAVDTFREDNGMDKKFENKPIEEVKDVIVDEVKEI